MKIRLRVLVPLVTAALAIAPRDGLAQHAPHIAAGGDTGHPLHLVLDGEATYGIGGQSFLGAQLHLRGYTGVWNTRDATGSIDLGAQLSYGNEPTWLAPWITSSTRGATHRIQALVTVGHSFHLGRERRATLGVHVFGGLSHWISSYTVEYGQEGVSGAATLARDHFVVGGELTFAYRITERFGLDLVAGGPFPWHSSYVVGMFFVGAGVSVYVL